jgi:hypothetical protein
MAKYLKDKTLIMPTGAAMEGDPTEFLAGKFVGYYCTETRGVRLVHSGQMSADN